VLQQNKDNKMARLTKEVLDKIRDNVELFALVANKMDIRPASLPMALERNGKSLNQYSIVKTIADFLGEDIEKIVAEDKDTTIAA